jgi:elongation factor G
MAALSPAPLFDRSIEVQPGPAWAELAQLAASPHVPRFRLDAERRRAVFTGPDETQLAVIVKSFGRQMRSAFVVGETTPAFRLRLAGAVVVESTHSVVAASGCEFARVKLLLWNGPPGSGFRFQSTASSDAVPPAFAPAVARGLREAAEGVWADLHVSLLNGAWHHQYSTTGAFERAAAAALRDPAVIRASEAAEPVARITVRAPEVYATAIEADLEAHGLVRHADLKGATRAIVADAAASNLLGYSQRMIEITGATPPCTVGLQRYLAEPEPAGDGLFPPAIDRRAAAAGRLELT